LIGKGYCTDWVYLPEGGYPAFLPASNPVSDKDKKRECANRCIMAAEKDKKYSTDAFYVRKDDKCGCARKQCDKQKKNESYSSFKINWKDEGEESSED
jgi:hypothetical protein